jgi:hypothetical protein
MRSLRIAAPVALGVAALVGVAATWSPMSGGASPRSAAPVVAYDAPVARAAGGDVPLLIPSIVNVRLVRAEAALEDASAAVDQGQEAEASKPSTTSSPPAPTW